MNENNEKYLKKFVIPKNYDIKPKFLGIIEYKFIFLLTILFIITYIILGNIIESFILKIQILIIIYLPIALISISGLNGEDITYIIKYLINYYTKSKYHIYLK